MSTELIQSPPHVMPSPEPHDGGVSLREFLLFAWKYRWLAVVSGLILAGGALLAAVLITPKYTASVVLLPVSNRNSSLGLGGLAGGMSQLGGLASLVGINIGGTGGQREEALATLQSRILTDQYIVAHDLLPILYSNKWNGKTHTWLGGRKAAVPTLWKANRLFQKKIRTVEVNSKTGLVKLSIRWKNPDQAAQWANGLVSLTNDYMRQRAINEAERSIAYLNEESGDTNIVAVKNAIYTLMEAEIKNEMVARSRKDFALKVIDPAVPPEKQSFPRPLLWTFVGLLGGLFVGYVIAIIKATFSDSSANRRSEDRSAAQPS